METLHGNCVACGESYEYTQEYVFGKLVDVHNHHCKREPVESQGTGQKPIDSRCFDEKLKDAELMETFHTEDE